MDGGAEGERRRDRSETVVGARQRKTAGERHGRLARLPAREAVQRRRDADRAAGVGSERDVAESEPDRHAAARRRAAGDAGRIARIARRAVVRVETHARIGELAHRGAAERHRAGRQQARHHGRVLTRRGTVAQQQGAGRGDEAGLVEQVLDRHPKAVQRQGFAPGAAAARGSAPPRRRGRCRSG